MSHPVPDPRGAPRLRPIDRQTGLPLTLDAAIAPDDEVRVVEAFTRTLDCSTLAAAVRSRVGTPGAPAYDPRLLLTLCLYATLRGRFAFRGLSAACGRDLPFMWLCGGSAPSYHTLSTFYAEHGDFLEPLLVEMLAALREQGLVTYEEVTVDGRKVAANASKETLHRVTTLTEHRREAATRVARLRAERDAKAASASQREAAQRRGAEDRLRRLDAALETLAVRTKGREAGRGDPAETRASETDPDARKMKMPDGGFRPALNVQTVTETASGLIVAVAVVDQACDNGLLATAVGQAETATGVKVKRVLADAGYSSAADVGALEAAETAVYMPARNERKEKAAGTDPYAPKRRDTKPVARWRARMGTAAARATYGKRAPVAEGSHARQSNRGFRRFRLRGLAKARTESLWHALAHNLRILMTRAWLTEGKIRRRDP